MRAQVRRVLLAHAGPHVRIHGVCAARRLHRIVEDSNRGAAFTGEGLRVLDDVRLGLKARRRRDAHRHPELRRHRQEGMAHIIPVAHIGELQAVESPQLLPQREEVAQGLAGVQQVRKGVDHGDGSVPGELRHRRVREGARRDAIHPALEVPRHVFDGLALAQARLGVVEVDGETAHAGHANLKADARAQRRLLKDQRQLLAFERAGKRARRRLHLGGEPEDQVQVREGEVALRHQVVNAKRFALGRFSRRPANLGPGGGSSRPANGFPDGYAGRGRGRYGVHACTSFFSSFCSRGRAARIGRKAAMSWST